MSERLYSPLHAQYDAPSFHFNSKRRSFVDLCSLMATSLNCTSGCGLRCFAMKRYTNTQRATTTEMFRDLSHCQWSPSLLVVFPFLLLFIFHIQSCSYLLQVLLRFFRWWGNKRRNERAETVLEILRDEISKLTFKRSFSSPCLKSLAHTAFYIWRGCATVCLVAHSSFHISLLKCWSALQEATNTT